MSPSLSIVFAGTPGFAVPCLEALVASRHRVLAVYTQPDRPAGRGRGLSMSPVKDCALGHGLPVEQPEMLRTPAAVDTLARYRPDVMVVVAYGLLLPPSILATPRYGCLNVHASLLPRWRGAAPIQRALLAGDARTGVGLMCMEAGLDTGPVILERSIDIGERETAGGLHDRLAALGAALLVEGLEGYVAGTLVPRPQPAEGVTYAHKVRKLEARIDWSGPAVGIDRQVRAFNPVPGAETLWQSRQLKVWESLPQASGTTAPPGTVLAVTGQGIEVATGAGVLVLTRVQLAGRNAVPAVEFARAHPVVGTELGGGVDGH